MPDDIQTIMLLFVGGVWAGAQNALAGGGSFVTLPVLMLTGLDARLANLTSTVALFPGQLAAGYRGRGMIGEEGPLGRAPLLGLSLGGGAIGAGLLLATPSDLFTQFVPWLILFATAIFILSGRRSGQGARTPTLGATGFGVVQFALAVYGGYFGGGGSFLLLAALSLAGFAARSAAAFKNILLALINAAAVLVFVVSGEAALGKAAVLGIGALVGSIAGVSILRRVDEVHLRWSVAAIGLALTAWLFATA